jgi:hypothetical protein
MAINPYSRPPQQNSQLRQLLLMLMMRDMMERQRQAQQQQPQQQGQQPNQTNKQVSDFLKMAKDAKDAYQGVSDMFNLGTSSASGLTQASNAAWNAGAGQAAQTAWNAGADAAGQAGQSAWNAGADAASGISSSGVGGSGTGTTAQSTPGTNWAGIAAAAMSAYNDYNKLSGDNLTDEQKALEGSRAIPRAVAAYYTGGLSLAAEGFARKQWGGTMGKLDKLAMKTDPFVLASRLWTSDKWKKEGNRIKQLLESGANIPEQFRGRMFQKRGMKKSELINPNYDINFQGMTKDGYVNNKFENSRNEADMTYETLAPYAAWAEKRNDWWNLSDAQRRAVTDAAQKAGAVREHHGTLDVDWNKVGDVDQIISSVKPEQPVFQRPGRGQVARVSAGMYMNDRGQVVRSPTSQGAMQSSYQIPRTGRK